LSDKIISLYIGETHKMGINERRIGTGMQVLTLGTHLAAVYIPIDIVTNTCYNRI
jgi:hypothetical protein